MSCDFKGDEKGKKILPAAMDKIKMEFGVQFPSEANLLLRIKRF